jgi:hypothetical protein
MLVNQLFYLGVLEQLLCMCLPYGFVGFLWHVAILNVVVWAEVRCMPHSKLLPPPSPQKTIIQGNYIRKAEHHYSEQQIPSPQPVHLVMAS